ncbi:MAG TPA: ABC transporter substrate-binding protein, partial [Acidimicrobiales bacterium]|nr:ABC transporter substrate-binding protein [Acidimicrobiales bacterium]
MTVDVPSVPTTLNPHTVAGDVAATRDVTEVVLPQVYQVTPGLVPQLDSDVAQASVQSINPLTVVYQINPNAVWSDGVPINSQDFVYSWRSQRGDGIDVNGEPDSVASTAGYRDIASVTGSNDDRTVTVVFKTQFADWPSLFDDLLPAHVGEVVGWNTGFDQYDPKALVSGGPWQVASWVPGQSMVLERNPRWWGVKPHLDRIVLRAVPGADQEVNDVVSGSAQVAQPDGFNGATLAQVSSHPHVESEASIGTTMLQLELNTRREPLNQIAVRQAIGHAIDRGALVTDLIGPMLPEAWVDNDFLAPNLQSDAYSDDAGSSSSVDEAAVSRLMEQAGLSEDASHTWTQFGTPVTLHLTWDADDPWSQLVGPALAAQLVSSGFDVSVEPVPTTELFDATLE